MNASVTFNLVFLEIKILDSVGQRVIVLSFNFFDCTNPITNSCQGFSDTIVSKTVVLLNNDHKN